MKKQNKVKVKSVELVYNEYDSDNKSGSIELNSNCIEQLILSNITDDLLVYKGETLNGYHCGKFMIKIFRNKVAWRDLNKILNDLSLISVILKYEDGTSKLYSLSTKWKVYETKHHQKNM